MKTLPPKIFYYDCVPGSFARSVDVGADVISDESGEESNQKSDETSRKNFSLSHAVHAESDVGKFY